MGDIRPQEKKKNIFLGTFEIYEFYGWFIEGKNVALLDRLLRETREGIGGRPAFPYVPLSKKKIDRKIVDYEAWFPILEKCLNRKSGRQLGWSRTNDFSFYMEEEEMERFIIDPLSVFTILCYEAEHETADKWKRARLIKEKSKNV